MKMESDKDDSLSLSRYKIQKRKIGENRNAVIRDGKRLKNAQNFNLNLTFKKTKHFYALS